MKKILFSIIVFIILISNCSLYLNQLTLYWSFVDSSEKTIYFKIDNQTQSNYENMKAVFSVTTNKETRLIESDSMFVRELSITSNNTIIILNPDEYIIDVDFYNIKINNEYTSLYIKSIETIRN